MLHVTWVKGRPALILWCMGIERSDWMILLVSYSTVDLQSTNRHLSHHAGMFWCRPTGFCKY